MIVHSLWVKDFCGLDDFKIEPLEKGITLIEGPNEAGKSCLARALYIVLEELDSSNSRLIQSLQPVNKDVGPIIEADIETGPYRFTIRKQFIKNKGTVLNILKPKPDNIRGRDAHDKVQDILNETLDVALWKALNIIQGEDVKEIPTNSSLSIALNQAAGTLPMGERELNLYDLVKAEKEKFLSGSKPVKEFKSAKLEKERLEKVVEALSKDFEGAERNVNEHSRVAKEVQDLMPLKLSLEKERIELTKKLEYALELQRTVNLEEEKEKRVNSEFDSAQKEDFNRKELIKKCSDAIREVKRLRDKGDFETDITSTQDEVNKAKDLLIEAENYADKARSSRDYYQRSKDYFDSQLWLEQFNERKSRIDKSRKESAASTLVLETNSVDDDVLTEITGANSKMEKASSQLNENSPTILVRPESSLEVFVNGEKIVLEPKKTFERAIPEEINITVPKVIDIKVMSGSSPDKLKKKHREALESLNQLLEKHGLSKPEEALMANREWHKAQSIVGQCKTIETDNLRDLKYEELVQKIYESELKVQKFDDDCPIGMTKPSNGDESLTLLLESSDMLEKAEENEREAKRVFEERSSKLSTLTQHGTKARTEIAAAESAVKTLESQLASSREQVSDESLRHDLEEKREQLRVQVENLKHKRTELAKIDLDMLTIAKDNSVNALEAFDGRLRDSTQKLSEIKVRIEILEEQGLFEKVNQAKSELEQANKEYEALSRGAEAASLLFEVMQTTKAETQATYTGPLKKRIENLGKFLFNDSFQVELDEELNVVSRTLNGLTLPYKSLSTGAKEQIGLITKLSCAMTVSKNGGVPLMIDDALGHTDSTRINGMATIIRVAGNDCQILLLTCMPSRYVGIGTMKTVSI